MKHDILKISQAAKVLDFAFRRTARRSVPESREARSFARDVARLRGWWSPNIAGFGIGPKEQRKGGKRARPVVRFYVFKKVHKTRLPKEHIIPAKIPFEHLEMEMATDVRQLAGVPQLNFGMGAGDEIGHFSGEQGTAGLFVKSNCDDGTFVLSCAHVLSPPGASIGDAIESPVDNDSTRAINQVATLEDAFTLSPGGGNPCDAAIARMDPAVEVSNAIPDLGTPVSLLTSPEDLVGTSVSQRGVTTGKVVSGAIREMSCSTSFSFRGSMFRVSNLVRYEIECQRGDSGAAVIENGTGRVLGIHMGSEAGTTSAYFSPAHLMTDRFDITL